MKSTAPKYAQQTFGMFASDAKAVELLIPADKIGILIDRFGKNIFFMPMEDGRLSVQLHIAISPAFYSWVFMLGSEVAHQLSSGSGGGISKAAA